MGLFNKKINASTFCMFIGYPRSGHTIIGSILDAHPNVIISNELDVIHYMLLGKSFKKVCKMILKNSSTYAKHGRINTGFDFSIKNSWQGKYSELKVIGDKKGGKTNNHLLKNYEILDSLKKFVPLELKFIHVTRNPYDIISTRYLRRENKNEKLFDRLIDNHVSMIRNVEKVRINKQVQLLDIKHEELILNPYQTLEKICNYLEIRYDKDWAEKCSSILYNKPNKSREKVKWTDENIIKVFNELYNIDSQKDYF